LLVALSLFIGLTTLFFAVAARVSGRSVPQTSILVAAIAAAVFLVLPLVLKRTGALFLAAVFQTHR